MMTFGFHCGPGGNLNGIGSHWRTLDAARIPAFLKSADYYGPCFELANIAAASGVKHTIIYRLSTRGQNNGIQYDVPDYSLSPIAAAGKHWTNTRAKLPPEFDKSRVWVEPINECDQERADWLGQFAVELAKLANGQGYKVTLFGWSSGEPEPTDWSTPGMLAYLRYCAANPGKAAVSLHEYSFDVDDILDGYPYKIGRFTQLLTTCQQNGIAPPEIHLTEWGWTYRNVPTPDEAMADLQIAFGVYAPYPTVKGAAIWNLGGGDEWGDIHNQTQRLIAPTTQFNLDHAGDTPPPQPPTGYKSVVYKLAQEHTVDEWAGIARLAYADSKRTTTASSDNCLVMVQDGNAESYAVVIDPSLPSQVSAIQQFTAAGISYQTRVYRDVTPPPTIPAGIDLLPYVKGDGRLYEVRHSSGGQERFQTQAKSGGVFWQTKNGQYEELAADDTYIWRGLDISPGPAPSYAERPGVLRYYTAKEAGKERARWCKRIMAVGETFTGPGHHVQFFYRDNCQPSAANSGNATNKTKLVAKHASKTWNGITVNDVIEMTNGTETWFFARGFGLVAWSSTWGNSAISEIHAPGARPDNVVDTGCWS